MRLDLYKKQPIAKREFITVALWFFIGRHFVQSSLFPFSLLKVVVLRLFGARIGRDVIIKPGVKIKFPWKLSVGNHVWLGECVWIDNLDTVRIEDHVCISQGAYLCTGNHDWSQEPFTLRTGKIHIQQGAWIAARAIIGPGVTVGQGAVLTLGSVASKTLDSMSVYAGNPAILIKQRHIRPHAQ